MATSISDGSCSPMRPSGPFSDPEKASPRPKQSMWHRLGFRRWLGRDDGASPQSPPGGSTPNNNNNKAHDNLTRRLSRRVGVGLPRATTFKRQNSERRDRLAPYQPEPRALSADRLRTLSVQGRRSPRSQPPAEHRLSAPEVQWRDTSVDTMVEETSETNQDSNLRSEWDRFPNATDPPEGVPADVIEMELEKRWILNLSMHFRDRSQREKFFVTYAETPNRWRRITISCDYRDASPDSLEQDLKELRYQRDKSARIYESLRESLPEIQFYDTVTNLKLETQDGRLHVHVTEDVNEIIPYPPISCVGHLYSARFVPEHKLHFDGHLSGFVYKVQLDGKSFVKKEIPGPETVDEFLYEINALHALNGSQHVVQVEGIVVDDRQEVVKGLLISYAELGALVDILYEQRGEISWARRQRWAMQIVHGLCEIHEAGYVQGDFTLSNIVVDANGDAKIIDINRRGCPVGWEPPEIAAKIESNQRISMYIGVKTDLFQLGMTLWALAMQDDEPERQDSPLVLDEGVDVPDYYRRLVAICLSPSPRHRLSAKELIAFFPPDTPTNHCLPPSHPQRNMNKEAFNARNGRLVPAAPLNPTAFGGYTENMDPGGLGRRSLDDGYSLSQCDSHFASVPPSAGRDSRTTLVDGETKARGSGLAEDSEFHGLLSLGDQYVRPPTFDPDERSIAFENPLHTEDAVRSTNLESDGAVRRMAFEETGEDLVADLCPSQKGVRENQKLHVPPLRRHALPKDHLGVGERAVCPLRDAYIRQQSPDSVQFGELSLTSSTTQSANSRQTLVADMGHTHTPDAAAAQAYRPMQALPRSVTSLFDSVLPINPCQKLSKELPPTNADQLHPYQAIHPASDHSLQHVQRHKARLSDSNLPINPALPNTPCCQRD